MHPQGVLDKPTMREEFKRFVRTGEATDNLCRTGRQAADAHIVSPERNSSKTPRSLKKADVT
jgi:hypothetical protein